MDRSRFLAALIGPSLALMAIGLFINQAELSGMILGIAQNPGVIFMSGVITLVAGLAVVLTHNVWSGWPTLVTVVGWLMVVGGAVRILLFPRIGEIAAHAAAAPATVAGGAAILLLIGLFLSVMAFRKPRAAA